jgi:hypothetical protein
MPCYDHRAHYDDHSPSRNRMMKDTAEKLATTHDRLDEVTRYLCSICSRAERDGHAYLIADLPPLLTWWQEHKAADARRADHP